jgi:Fe-S cluster assembly protein SufB
VVEIVVKRGGRCRYTTIQNWSNNVYNLVTKRAAAYADATMEWVDGNLGSKLTMKYPAVWLMEPGAHGEVLSIAFAGPGQHQDTGAKMVHAAPNTTSTILSKSITKGGGRAGYRGLVRVEPGAEKAKSFVRCDALILDDASRSDTYPYMEIEEADTQIGHEATVSKVGEDQLFYLMSRGLTEDEATSMVVAGFIEPIVKELPMEYAVEMNRLIELPYMEIEEADTQIGHEATVSKVGEDQLFYLMSRGLTEDEATSMVVAGFIEPIVKELPMEYAVEMNRLIELNMLEAGAVG